MKHVLLSITILFGILLANTTALSAQEKEKKDKPKFKLHPSIEANYLVGGLINSDNFVFKSGIGGHFIADFKFSDKVYYGIGAGYEQLENDNFVPIFLDVKGFLKKKKASAYFTGQLGYSIAWNDDLYNYNSYSYKGGIMFSPGIGYKIPVKDHTFLINVSYRQQFARIEYDAPGETYKDDLSFVMLAFKLGLLF